MGAIKLLVISGLKLCSAIFGGIRPNQPCLIVLYSLFHPQTITLTSCVFTSAKSSQMLKEWLYEIERLLVHEFK